MKDRADVQDFRNPVRRIAAAPRQVRSGSPVNWVGCPAASTEPLTHETTNMTEFAPKHDYFIGIDSDGCAFDTMELKLKECFIPNVISFWGLQGVSKYAREAAEFVSLYSKSRGTNRFPALLETLDWTSRRPEVKARGVQPRIPRSLLDWTTRETKLANSVLEDEVRRTGDPDLKQALDWSKAVDESILRMVRGVPPFPLVRECLERLCPQADIVVISTASGEALRREWEEHDLAKYVAAIRGQESGTKEETLQVAAKYPANRALMIGDSPGDQQAAVANKALFFPINPGAEEASWRRFHEEGIDRFLANMFTGEYQAELLAEFERFLPATPPWPADEG
jgi:phosphoglycolate phosphatase-like HAD superfamily hydrolase